MSGHSEGRRPSFLRSGLSADAMALPQLLNQHGFANLGICGAMCRGVGLPDSHHQTGKAICSPRAIRATSQSLKKAVDQPTPSSGSDRKALHPLTWLTAAESFIKSSRSEKRELGAVGCCA